MWLIDAMQLCIKVFENKDRLFGNYTHFNSKMRVGVKGEPSSFLFGNILYGEKFSLYIQFNINVTILEKAVLIKQEFWLEFDQIWPVVQPFSIGDVASDT